MELDAIVVRSALEPIAATPRIRLGKRMRTLKGTVEVLVILEFRLELPNIKDTEIAKLKKLL